MALPNDSNGAFQRDSGKRYIFLEGKVMKMILRKVIGNLATMDNSQYQVERIFLTWDELSKRMMRKTTDRGNQVAVVVPEGVRLKDGDVLYCEDNRVIAVQLLTEDVLVVKAKNYHQLGWICYHLGYQQSRIMITGKEVLVPFNPGIHTFLLHNGLNVKRCFRRFMDDSGDGTATQNVQ